MKDWENWLFWEREKQRLSEEWWASVYVDGEPLMKGPHWDRIRCQLSITP